MKHVDLFSGIGGFALAAQWIGFETVVFCEKDEFCQKVLKKHWPEVSIIPEIRDFDGTKWRGATLLTGGFPCQPFSTAGRRRGKKDDRYLWPEMLRIVSKARPAWVIAENVTNIVNMVLADCENDLEAEGYEVQSFDIPACAYSLSTMERHIWIVATCRSKHMEGGSKECISWEQKLLECFGGKANKSPKRFFRVPDLCRPKLHRSRKGISHWVDRHKSLRNAIIPQVAAEIMRGIRIIEENKRGVDY